MGGGADREDDRLIVALGAGAGNGLEKMLPDSYRP